MAQHWKKRASVAYGYSLTRLALNTYMYYEELPLAYDERAGEQEETDRQYMELLGAFLDGNCSAEQIRSFREDIRKRMELVVAYADSFRIYEYALNRMEKRFQEELPAPVCSDEEFVHALMGYVTAVKDAAAMNQRIGQIIGQLPVRFTRQKYYSLVQEALSAYIGSDRSGLDGIMYLLRTSGMAELTKEQRAEKPELDELLDELSKLSFKNMDAGQYQNAQNQVILASERLNALAEYYQLVEEMVNDLYVLSLTKADAIRDIGEEKHAYGILNALCGLYRQSVRQIPEELEQELEALEGTQEAYFEKYQRLDPAPEYQEGEEENAAWGRWVDRLMSSSPFALLEEAAAGGTVDRRDVEREAEAFFALMEPVFKSVQKPVMRAIMATTLSYLPLCFNSLDEIQEYIRNSFASCTDLAEKETCMELLQQLMESDGYAVV